MVAAVVVVAMAVTHLEPTCSGSDGVVAALVAEMIAVGGSDDVD